MQIHCMKFAKLTASLFILALAACDKDSTNSEKSFVKTGLSVTAAQSIPSLPTAGSGTLDLEYTPVNKTLNYKLTWTNLTDSVIAIRINGPAPSGANSINVAFTGASPTSPGTTPHTVIQEFVGTATKSLYPKSGSLTGTLFIDGVKVKEELLLAGLYYFTIHTKTIIPPPVTAPSNLAYRWFGELRAQIIVN